MEYDDNDAIQRRYIHGPGADNPYLWFEGPVMDGTNPRYLIADHQGSIIGYSDATGKVPAGAVYRYDAYGAPDAWAGSRFRYTGQIAIPEAKLCPQGPHVRPHRRPVPPDRPRGV